VTSPALAKRDKDEQIINYPIIGKINLSKMSLPVLTILLAALDGFNPCAMWVLLFLIALLINVRSRKRIWIVGGTIYCCFRNCLLSAFSRLA